VYLKLLIAFGIIGAKQYLSGLKHLKIRGRSSYLIKGRKLRRSIVLAISLQALLHLHREVLHRAFLPAANHLNQGLARRLRWRRWSLLLGAESGAGENGEDNKNSSAK
jgi:hypothetical protein